VCVISRAIYHGQPEDGTRQRGIAHDGALHRDLVVFIVEPVDHRPQPLDRLRAIGIQHGAERRILGQRRIIDRDVLPPMQDAAGPIDIHAAERDDAARDAPEHLHIHARLPLGAEDEIDDHIRHRPSELAGKIGQVLAVSVDMVTGRWPSARPR